MRRFTMILILVSLIVLVGPSLRAGQVPPETSDLVAKEQTLSTGRYDERASLVVPERPLGFAAEIQYQASVDDRRNVPKPAFLRLTVAPPGGRAREEIALKPGEKKSGVLRLPPGHQLRVESYSGQYTTLLIKNGADIKCKLRWPEFRFTAQEQTRHYGFAMTAAGWQEVDRWVWDFGDGKGAEGAAVEHLYRAPGTYRLEVLGYDGPDIIQRYQRNMVVPDFIEVNPAVGPLEGYAEMKLGARSGLSVHYGEEADVIWDFGDGSPPAGGPTAEHLYRRPGRYAVTMTARHTASDHTVRRTWTVTVRPISIQPMAQVTPLEGPIPLRVDVAAQPRVDGGPVDLAYRWDFGDGNLAEQTKATHYYGAVGQYQVTLAIKDRLHPDLVIGPATFLVRALPPAVAVNPMASPANGSVPLTVAFAPGVSVRGYPYDLQYRWDFGDGFSSKEAAPVHTFQANGDYNVQLTVTDVLNRTETRGRVRVAVRPPAEIQVEAFAEPYTGRAPLTVTFTAQAYCRDPEAKNYLEYTWDFGDRSGASGATATHTYQTRGEYRVVLAVRDARPGKTAYAQAELLVTVK